MVMNLKPFPLALIFLVASVLAHGDHPQEHVSGDAAEYARRHMATEHHIDTFDLASFFQLHDLNRQVHN